MVKITGKGEIEEVVRGKVYKIRHHLGYDEKLKKYVRSPKRTIYGTKADARRALEDYRRELEMGYSNPDKLTVGSYARIWQNRREKLADLSPLTLKADKLQVDRIEEHFGKTYLNELTTADINRVYLKLAEDGKASPSTIHHLNGVLSQVFDSAVEEMLVPTNPCAAVHAPRPKPKERKALSLEQAMALAQDLQVSEKTGNTVAVWLALATGIRRGEALGLTWGNVDFEHKRIYIGQQYAADRKLRPPKSENANRWIGIDDGTVAFLKDWKAKQERKMEIQGIRQADETPVCTNEIFKFTDPNTFSRWRRQYFVDHGLGEFTEKTSYTDSQGRKRVKRGGYVGFNFHELRHTQATLLIGSGADIKTVQQRLGHSSASLTMDIYAHFIAQNDRKAADTIGDMLGNGKSLPEWPSPVVELRYSCLSDMP